MPSAAKTKKTKAKKQPEGVNSKDYPLIISFYAGDDYYYRSADLLREDCDRLGLDHHIVEPDLPKDTPWIELCRFKIRFIRDCVVKFDRPVMWIDVDCRILSLPEMLKNSQADFGLFLRGFRYFKTFDPASVSRMAQPSILYYNSTPRMKEFVQLMADIEDGHQANATDDYFLQEAWQEYDKDLNILLIAPDTVTFDLEDDEGKTFYFGRSGSVAEFKGEATQHDINLYTPERRTKVLIREATDLVKEGRNREAIGLLQRASFHSPEDFGLAYRVAARMRLNGDPKGAIRFLKTFQENSENYHLDYAKRFIIDTYLSQRKFSKAHKLATKLAQNGSEEDKAWALSRLMRLDMEKRARAKRIPQSKRIKLWWMESPYPGNFGDILNPYVIEKLSGIPPVLAPRGKGMLAIGSTIKFAKADTDVWGSGTPRMTDHLSPKAKYHAVRGPLTRELVLESGGECDEVYGDPALFLPKIYKPKSTKKKYKLGLIRHYKNDEDLHADKDVKVISVMRAGYDGIEAFIDEINQCEKILTTSLHGLIVSHAYGIPAQWCEVVDGDDPIPGDGTKYHDYMLSVGLKKVDPIEFKAGTTVTTKDASKVKQLPKKTVDLKKLAEVAPFKVKIDLD